MTQPNVTLYLDSEANRAASTVVPAPRNLAITESDAYIGDGSTPASQMQPPYERRGTIAPVIASVQQLASRSVPAPRSVSYSPPGMFKVGMCARGPFLNAGFDAGAVTVRCDNAPTGAAAILQILDGSTLGVLYTITILDGSTAYDDLSAAFHINDRTQLKFNFTQVGSTYPGSEMTVEIAESAGATAGSQIGAASDLTAPVVGSASVSLAWQYTGLATPDHFTVVTKAGASPPTSMTDGTAVNVPGNTLTAQSTGRTAATAYSFGVWPVASDGTVGTPAILANITTAAVADTTWPAQITGLTATVSQGSATLSWTPPGDVDFAGVIVRQKNNVPTTTTWAALTPGTRPTEGHPASGALTSTGDGLVWTVAQGATFTRSGLSASTGYSFAVWTYDAAGNVNPTPVVVNVTTTAAPAGLQGDNAKVPATYNLVGSETWAGAVGDHFAWDQWEKHGEQGPTARSNVDIITDPILGGTNKVARLQMSRITNGWLTSSSSIYTQHPGWFYINGTSPAQYTQDGTGWYGARGNAKWPSQASGAWEVVWWIAKNDGSTATALGYGTKGLTWLIMPDTGWPADELDAIEIFNASQLQANMHYKTSSGGNGQLHGGTGASQPFNLFAPITSTLLWEPAPAGTGGTGTGGIGRIRLWHKQAGVTGDSGVGTPLTWFDTNKPYVMTGSPTDDGVQRLLSAANPGGMGLVVAYNTGANSYDANNNLIGSNFGCPVGTSGNARTGHAALIRKVSQWSAA